MPFTPFHMGPALLLKGVAGRRFSLLVFGISQVLIDVEPLIRIIRRDPVLHGFSHTIAGALLIGGVAAAIGRPVVNWFLAAWRRGSRDAWAARFHSSDVTWRVAFASAGVGTGSHLVLDAAMHADMQPLAPFTAANPLLHAIGVGPLHLLCLGSGVLGLAIIMGLAIRSMSSGASRT